MFYIYMWIFPGRSSLVSSSHSKCIMCPSPAQTFWSYIFPSHPHQLPKTPQKTPYIYIYITYTIYILYIIYIYTSPFKYPATQSSYLYPQKRACRLFKAKSTFRWTPRPKSKSKTFPRKKKILGGGSHGSQMAMNGRGSHNQPELGTKNDLTV